MADNVKVSGFTISESNSSITGSGNGTIIIGNIITQTADNTVKLSGSNCIVANNNSTAQGSGIQISGSNNNVTGNIVVASGIAITVVGSFNNVDENRIDSGIIGHQIEGNSNLITKNDIPEGGTGMTFESSSFNVVIANKVTDHNFGAIRLQCAFNKLQSSNNNSIIGNYLAHNGFGVQIGNRLCTAESNIFYHNVFVENEDAPRIFNETSVNYWDNGKEGNFWDDYNSTDSNRDGIGDVPYVINENNIDNYPLIAPFYIENNTKCCRHPNLFQ